MGSLSTHSPRGVPRLLVRLPGFRVRGTLLMPEAHPHALWLLAWIEALLRGRTLEQVQAAPPWPAPPDPVIGRLLAQELVDLGWALPDWSGGELRVAPELAADFEVGGRDRLARRLFRTDEVDGEWWMDSVTGTLLSRAMVGAFDWDRSTRADRVLEPIASPEEILLDTQPEVRELLAKLSGFKAGRRERDRAYLGAPLEVDEPIDLLFPMWGPKDRRLLPDELADLEPGLREAHPDLFGVPASRCSRVIRLPRRPVEDVARAVEVLPLRSAELPPATVVARQVAGLRALVGRRAETLADWLADGLHLRPVAGPTDVHFAALGELCAGLGPGGVALITSAFLNPEHAAAPGGLVDRLAAAPPGARFVLVYGHADDLTLSQQHDDIDRYLAAVRETDPDVASRLVVVPGRHRSHEKLAVTSSGDWMLGSWNATSSRPGAILMECGLSGRDGLLSLDLARRVLDNIEDPRARELVEELVARLESRDSTSDRSGDEDAAAAVQRLDAACALLLRAIPRPDGSRDDAWPDCILAVRAALQPFRQVARAQLVDELQTRELLLQHVGTARSDVLLASDRLGEGGLDPATLADLRGRARLVRVLWGREWAEVGAGGKRGSRQLQRARRTVREARRLLGRGLLTSDQPMENHAKGVLVDGLHGLITSENLLSYGGEKGQRESRELGLSFASPVVARDLLGRLILWRVGALERPDGETGGPPLPWLAAASEAWHALAPVADELDFSWDDPTFLDAVVQDEAEALAERDGGERVEALRRLRQTRGVPPMCQLLGEARRLGLALCTDAGRWLPWDGGVGVDVIELLDRAEAAVKALPADEPVPTAPGAPTPVAGVHPAVRRVEELLVRIPAGRFRMGDDRADGEGPCHPVLISRPFLLAATPVTQSLWLEVMGKTPRLRPIEEGPDHPIIQVSMREIRQFLARLNTLPGGGDFELPTEAQWEYACRAGSDAAYCFGDEPGWGQRPGELERYAWTKRNAGKRSHEVGRLEPNAWGLFDMHGLVYETVRDGRRSYDGTEAVDPVGPDRPPWVARGGCWGRFPVRRNDREGEHFRCASRQIHEPSHRVGFRLMRRLEDG